MEPNASARAITSDVVQIQKSGDLFRLLYNTKGRFVLHRISEEESKFKLCRVNKVRDETRVK